MEALPEEAMLLVLKGIGPDAKLVARCAPVCKRWSSLVRYVDTLSFSIAEGSSQQQLKPLVKMLQKLHGLRSLALNLEHQLYFTNDLHQMVKLVQSTLECLCISGIVNFEHSFWIRLKRCRKLRKLCLEGGSNGLAFAGPPCDMSNLREFVLDESCIQFPETVWSAVHAGYNFEAEMNTLLERCPKLEKLVVKKLLNFKIKLTSQSIKEAHFQGLNCKSFIMLEAPNLERLTIDSLGCVLCAPKLLNLHLPSRCKDLIVMTLDALQLLTMGGDGWEFEEIPGIMDLASTVRELWMQLSVVDPRPVSWPSFFKDLRNLRILGLGGNLLQCFCDEFDTDAIRKLRLTKLTISLEDSCFQTQSLLAMLEALLENCLTLKEVIVKCTSLRNKDQQGSSESEHFDLHKELVELQQMHLTRLRLLCVVKDAKAKAA